MVGLSASNNGGNDGASISAVLTFSSAMVWSSPSIGEHSWGMAERFEYKVIELREQMIGGKMSGDKLAEILNDHAAQGWRLKTITSAEIKGRVGPGGVDGLLITFERGVG
jgi:hypothetical protein